MNTPANYIPMKQWRYEQAALAGVTETAIANRIAVGRYPNLKTLRFNKRVVFVWVGDCRRDTGNE